MKLLGNSLMKIRRYVRTNVEIDLIHNYVEIPFLWRKIRKYINPNVKKLRISLEVITKEDLEDLKEFPNLEIVDLGDVLINEKVLEKFKNMNIKEILVGDVIFNYENNRNDVYTLQYGTKFVLFYNGLKVSIKAPKRTNVKEIIIEISELNKEKLENLLSIVNVNSFKYINLKVCSNSYSIKYNGKKLEKIEVISDSVYEVNEVFNYFLTNNFSIEEVVVSFNSIEIDYVKELERLCYVLGDKSIKEVKVSYANIKKLGKDYINIINGEIEVRFLALEMNDVISLYNFFDKSELKLRKMEIDVNFVDKYSESYDFEFLRKVSKKVDLVFKYGLYFMDFEEFYECVQTIKWYRSLISENDLSPMEKLFYAYDIFKSFECKLEKDNIKGKGYFCFFSEIVNNLDSGIDAFSDIYIDNSVGVVRIDDGKYDIHGIFILNPMVESKKEFINENYKGSNFNLDFLLPIKDYVKSFGREKIPLSIKVLITKEENRELFDKVYLEKFLNTLFNENNENKAREYLKVKRPSLNELISMVKSVRKNEGYSEEKNVEVNKISCDFLNQY